MSKILLNNQLISASELPIKANDRGLTLGDGLFETIRVYAGKTPFLTDHWLRLNQGVQVLQFKLPFTETEFKNKIKQILQANEFENKDAVLRLTLTRGTGERGISISLAAIPTVLLTADVYVPNEKLALTAHIVAIRRNEYSPLANIKSLNYLDNILARQQAVQYGADEALLFNTKNYLAEASVANVFMVLNNVLYTPFLQDGALPGVVRKQIFILGEKNNFKVVEKNISKQDLLAASEIFLTNSLWEIIPVIKIDEYIIAQGIIGDVTKNVRKLFKELIYHADESRYPS